MPGTQTVDEAHRDALLQIATPRRTPTWEGRAWAGATVSPADRLRYALLVPRLIAPHPNAGVPDDIDAEACLALIVLNRADEPGPQLARHPPARARNRAVQRGLRSELAVLLNDYLAGGDPQPLVGPARRAADPADRAAGAVTAASALLEQQRLDDALDLLDARRHDVQIRNLNGVQHRQAGAPSSTPPLPLPRRRCSKPPGEARAMAPR